MTLDHLKLLHSYCAFPFWYGMHYRVNFDCVTDDLNVMCYSSLFHYYFSIYYGPYSS